MVGSFHTLVVPDLLTLSKGMPIDPLSSYFDFMGQISISGIFRNISMETLLSKFWGAGNINVEGITGAFVSRGHGKATQPKNQIQTEDVLFIMGTNLLKSPINPSNSLFFEIAESDNSLYLSHNVGNFYRNKKRQEHGEAMAAHRAAKATAEQPNVIALVEREVNERGVSRMDAQLTRTLAEQSETLSIILNRVEMMEVNRAADARVVTARAEEAERAEAATGKKEPRNGMKTEKRVRHEM